MDLFDNEREAKASPRPPLADRMRPNTLEGFFGQPHLTGEGKIISGYLKSRMVASLILWGPPGSGKTTLASIISKAIRAHYVSFSAVLSGVKEIRQVVAEAQDVKRFHQSKTVLFVDEIHRFNKAQQDAFLPHVEDGTLVLIGATTENPSFYVNAPLLSRSQVVVLNPLSPGDLIQIMRRALRDSENGLGSLGIVVEDPVLEFLAGVSGGDARFCLNALEAATHLIPSRDHQSKNLSMEVAEEAVQKKSLLYDKQGEEHFNVISAFIKSMRGSNPDGAMYWMARMVEAGEDPLYIARRMVIFASEDIGNADPHAILIALAVKEAVDFVGKAEAWISLAQGVCYLSNAPKSNASYSAYQSAVQDVRERGALPVPIHLRNAPTPLMKNLGYGKDYRNPHFEGDFATEPGYLPEGLQGRSYYCPIPPMVGKSGPKRMKSNRPGTNKKKKQ